MYNRHCCYKQRIFKEADENPTHPHEKSEKRRDEENVVIVEIKYGNETNFGNNVVTQINRKFKLSKKNCVSTSHRIRSLSNVNRIKNNSTE